jgi:hypothetical protein
MCDGICNRCSRSSACDEDYSLYAGEDEDTDDLSLQAMSHCQNDQDVEDNNKSEC